MQKHEDRILFLKEFTKELVINSKAKSQEVFTPFIHAENLPVAKPLPREIKKPAPNFPPRNFPIRLAYTKPVSENLYKKYFQPEKSQPEMALSIVSKEETAKQEIKPISSPLPSNFDLGKLNVLIADPYVNAVECPGPGKLVLVRTYAETKTTKLSFSQSEIQSIIEKFSAQAKIPVIPGIFKAAVGNLLITAVISELAGNRFIITKLASYS